MDLLAFNQLVRAALGRLYDRPYLEGHGLARWLSGRGESLSGDAVHRLLVNAIEEMRPPEAAPLTSPCLRRYRCLALRYLQGATPEMIARQLGMSPRQTRRDHAEAVDALAALLWERRRRLDEGHEQTRLALGERPGAATAGDGPVESSLDAELSKLGAGHQAGPSSLTDGVVDALSIVAGLAAARRVRFESPLPSTTLAPVAVDAIILRQALVHVLGYATDVGRGGGVALRTEESGEEVRLEVEIPAWDASTRPATDEAGALLAAGRRLIEAQGGTLQHAAAPGGGQRLILALPTQIGASVLVVDDNPDVARLFRRFLRGRNYRLHHASTGQKALEFAREARPDAITLDLLMPTQDGWDTLRQLKAQPETRAIPVAVCSILPDRDLAASMGAAGFLPKPVTQQALVATVESLIALSRSAGHSG